VIKNGPIVTEFEFHNNKPVDTSVQPTLQSIRCFNYRSLIDNNQLSFSMLFNGQEKFGTNNNSYRKDTYHVEYELIDLNEVNILLSLDAPDETFVGTYEFQFHIHDRLLIEELNRSGCQDSYLDFVANGIRADYFLVGNAIIQVKKAGTIFMKYL